MPIVVMPDGMHVQMPDDPASPEAKAMADGQSGIWNTVKPYLKQGGRAVANTLLSAAGGFGTGGQLDPTTMKPVETPLEKKGRALIDEYLPDQAINPWAKAAIDGVGGGLASPGSLGLRLTAGLAGGVGGEVGAKVTNENPLGRLAGTVIGGAAGGATASRVSQAAPTVRTLAREGVEGLPAGALEKAQAFQAEAAKQGVKIDLPQALSAVGVSEQNLTTIRNVLAGNRHGNNVQATLRGQPGELELASATAIGALPGAVRQPEIAANNLAQASSNAIDTAKKGVQAQTAPLFGAVGNAAPGTRQSFVDILNEARQLPGTTSTTTAKIDAALEQLKATPSTGVPATHALDFRTILRELSGPYKGQPLTVADPLSVGPLKNLTAKLNTALTGDATTAAASPELAIANARHGQLMADVVDPMKQGPIGTLAGRSGYKTDTQTPVSRLTTLFAQGSDPAAPTSSIRTVGKELNKSDPGAFADAAKTYYSGKVAEAFKPTLGAETGATNADAAAKLDGLLFKDKKQWQGMKDAASVVAEGAGLNPADVVKGLENFGQLVRAGANRPGTVGGLSKEEAFKLGGNSYGADALRVFGFLPFERVARAIEDKVVGKTFREFDKILTTPDGAKMLADLSKVPILSDTAQTIMATWGAAQASQAVPKPAPVTRP